MRMNTILLFTQSWKTQNYGVNSQEERGGSDWEEYEAGNVLFLDLGGS